MTTTTDKGKSLTDEELLAIVEAATRVSPGPWEHDTEENEGAYGSGPDACHGFKSYVMFDGKGRRIFDASNTEIAEVSEEFDEDGCHAWDENGRIVAEFSATFDPPMVRALIERARAAEAHVSDLLEQNARLKADLSDEEKRSNKYLEEAFYEVGGVPRLWSARALAMEEALTLAEADLWHRLWNALGHESSLARGLSHLGETRFREILRTALSSTEAQS